MFISDIYERLSIDWNKSKDFFIHEHLNIQINTLIFI